ncbi:MAG: hypothetical protein H6732_10205 [Alphaproteobacteria bacterium]|nr:hypothetical protein [Alphaproteobacteria bacterium]
MRRLVKVLLAAGLACAGPSTQGPQSVGKGSDSADTDDVADSGDSGDSGDSAPDEPKAPVEIRVVGAYETDPLDGRRASEDRFLVVELTLTNRSGQGIPTSAAAFLVETDKGLQRLPDPLATQRTATPCAATALLASGRDVTCTLAVDLPADEHGAALVYPYTTAFGPLQARAPFQARGCTDCGSDCVDVQTDANHCGRCDNQLPPNATCLAGTPTCTDAALSWCTYQCVDLKRDSAHCGACDARVGPRQVCRQGMPACGVTFPDACSTGCVDVDIDKQHCGMCEQPAPNNTQCVAGEPACPTTAAPDLCGDTCVDLLESAAHCGGCDKPCAGGESCSDGACVQREERTVRVSCDAVCGSVGLVCKAARARFAYSIWAVVFDQDCDEVPEISGYHSPSSLDLPFQKVICDCVAP